MIHHSFPRVRMMLVVVCLAGGGLAGLSGCNPASPDTVTVTEQDTNSTIELHTGEILQVVLRCNPSTGYAWDPTFFEATILEQQRGSEFIADNPALGITGSPGTITVSFRAIIAGRTPLRLIYHRSTGFDTSAMDTFEVTVVVSNG